MSISPDLYAQIAEGINRLPGEKTKSEIIAHLLWWLIFNRWHYGSGDIVQNVHNFPIRSSTSGVLPEATNHVTQELATPKYSL